MRNVVAIHLEVSGSDHLEHIAKLRWVETSSAGERAGNQTVYESTRFQMYEFAKKNREQAYAISRNGDTYAFLVAVDNGHVQYVRTEPDSTRADNLLSLPQF
jgi:hypothetical protein